MTRPAYVSPLMTRETAELFVEATKPLTSTKRAEIFRTAIVNDRLTPGARDVLSTALVIVEAGN